MLRRFQFAALAVSFLLPVCSTTSMLSVEQRETEGISGYLACLEAAAQRLDDGRPDRRSSYFFRASAFMVAPGILAGSANFAAQALFTRRRSLRRARQLELSTMVVLDVRGQP